MEGVGEGVEDQLNMQHDQRRGMREAERDEHRNLQQRDQARLMRNDSERGMLNDEEERMRPEGGGPQINNQRVRFEERNELGRGMRMRRGGMRSRGRHEDEVGRHEGWTERAKSKGNPGG